MKVAFSKSFQKAFRKLSGKMQESVANVIRHVKHTEHVDDIPNCKRLIGFESVYRIRIGSYRAFFILRIKKDTAFFEYLISRGEAYSKKTIEQLRKKDK
ncbi:type II toxin-antitoxin system RelE family toxin [Maribellus sediminis]|uniref:type II toxin-antitoxin system RelE family toxin n=1 Tax=Maribellus sediminis TaxID=2696285 RepID=UPI00142FC8A4|nr:hypothetical protein [Maribellus sediminis]